MVISFHLVTPWWDKSEQMQEESAGEGKWISLRIRSPAPVQEALTNFLIEQTNRGVQVEGEWITAFCHQGTEARDCLNRLTRYYKALQQLNPGLPELDVIQDDLQEEEWAESWKVFFKPLRIGRGVVVKPTWEPYQAIAGEVIVEIDPGRAFGTGKHPSTALCIEILEHLFNDILPSILDSASSVLDVGTGSGILGIVAARLGANRVLGLDIDPDALGVAARNLERNKVGEIMWVSSTPIDKLEETFEVVVANLTAAVITQMSAPLVNRVADRGWLLLGGILDEQVEGVVRSFQFHDFQLVQSRSTEEWRAILLRRY
jgi:ribosomal protein L11 methyltransferase